MPPLWQLRAPLHHPVGLDEHWDIQSYTSPRHEERFKRARQPFFEWLANLALRELPQGFRCPRVLDVGCSYGHLLETFDKCGCDCFGIEPVQRLRNRLNGQGKFHVYGTIDGLPGHDLPYDVITLIDSLYYFEDPVRDLGRLARRLSPDGVVVIRVTNRTPLLDVCRKLLRRGITNELFGDQLFAFSHRGMTAALGEAGLKMTALRFFERKPLTGRGLAGFAYYGLVPAFCAVTKLKLTPGLTYLCARSGPRLAAEAVPDRWDLARPVV